MSVLNTGRPIKRKGKAAAAHRKSAQKWYANLSEAEKQAYIHRRSKSAQRKANAKRDRVDKADRTSYHKKLTSPQHAAEESGKLKQPKTCSYPGCNRTDVQFHHTGSSPTRGRYLCAKHNNRAKPTKAGR
jgi:hypothetical protein